MGTAYGIGLNLDAKINWNFQKIQYFGSMIAEDPATKAYVKAMQQSKADSLATKLRLKKRTVSR